MSTSALGSKSLKDYLKRYGSKTEEEKKGKKKKKKKENSKPDAAGVLVVDEDPVWQKPVNLEEEEDADESGDEGKPQIDEDIEVKRMKRLQELKARRPYNAISEDGSGWVSLSPVCANSTVSNADMSPPRKPRARNDTPSPNHELKPSDSGKDGMDLSPPRQRLGSHLPHQSSDLSPTRKRRARNDTPSPGPELRHLDSRTEDSDLSPPRHRRKQSLEDNKKDNSVSGMPSDISPPRRGTTNSSQRRNSEYSESLDISPPRRGSHGVKGLDDGNVARGSDLSPPRKRSTLGRVGSPDISSQHKTRYTAETDATQASLSPDLSPPRKNKKEVVPPASLKEQRKTGLVSGKEMRDEIAKAKKDDWIRFNEMDPSISGRGAEPVYRDKIKGERISKEEFLKLRGKVKEKPKEEKKLEWGKGLAQKREAEAKLEELEVEKDKPFARTRDDPDLDKMLKERVRWGDPMAHLVKKKHFDPLLPDLGEGEKMKESGFIIPQDIPSHSWLRRGLDAAPNRYGITPGRHWDGVDRSNGFERDLFKKMNEKRATEKEAYLWSISDM